MSAAKEPPLPVEIRSRLDEMDDSATAEEWRAVGNACFAHGCNIAAIRCYTRALESGEETAVLRSNRSAAYLKSPMLAGPSLALKDAERAVELDATWYKAHLRVGDAQLARKKYEEAKRAYQRALELNSRCEAATESLRVVEREIFLLSLDKLPTATAGGVSDRSATSTFDGATATVLTESTTHEPRTAEEEIARNIQEWSEEAIFDGNRTAMRAFNARLDEADRETGVAYKKALMTRFRGKLETDASLRHGIEERRDQEMRLGESVDYRNADSHRAMLMKGTNGVGLGISTDAYKSFKHESKMW